MRLHLASTPAVTLYNSQAEAAYLTTDLAYFCPSTLGALNFEAEQNPSLTVSLSPPAFFIAQLYNLGLLGQRANLYQGADALFSGVVRRMSVSAGVLAITLEQETANGIPYTKIIDLRETTAWGVYRSQEVIPIVLGHTTVRPLEYSADRKQFVLADHAIGGVDAVFRNQQPEPAFTWRNAADSAGATVALLELATPLAEGEDLRAELRGKLASDGSLIQDANAILTDVLGTSWRGLPTLELGGAITEPLSLQALAREVLASIGYDFIPGTPTAVISRWPTIPATARGIVSQQPAVAHPSGWLVQTWGFNLDNRPVSRLRVLYNYDPEQQDHRGALELEAVGVDGNEHTLALPWLRHARDALTLGLQAATWLGRPLAALEFELDLESPARAVWPGDWLDVQLSGCPIAGICDVQTAVHNYQTGTQQIRLRVPFAPTPQVNLTRLAEGYYPQAQAGVSPSLVAGTLTLTLTDEKGAPLVAADVTLVGMQQTRRTGSDGAVQFVGVQPGRHQLLIERAGYGSQIAEIIL